MNEFGKVAGDKINFYKIQLYFYTLAVSKTKKEIEKCNNFL